VRARSPGDGRSQQTSHRHADHPEALGFGVALGRGEDDRSNHRQEPFGGEVRADLPVSRWASRYSTKPTPPPNPIPEDLSEASPAASAVDRLLR
jgi:hypothetical protein